ncbi:OsmC family protein [Salininema proteolyticum]|uniref:OsmC family protein n=1 Tax=Salininema proteolyticum TaxID=1607685 RepID=A0ABV8TVE6_9ACTN
MPKTHHYALTTVWTGAGDGGTTGYRDYGREHTVSTDGKPDLHGSADPTFLGTDDRWNPEELLLAALSQCHMLSYLSLCSREGIVVTAYEDRATGEMLTSPRIRGHFTKALLSPVVTLHVDTAEADRERARGLHRRAHEECFIANSVNFPVECEPEIR